MDDKTRYQSNSTGRKHQYDPGSRMTASEYSNRLRKVVQPAEIIPAAERPISSVDAASLPRNFSRASEFVPSGLPWSDIVRSILRFKWTVLAIFILVAAPAIAAIWTQVVPKYQAKGQIRIRPIIPYLVFPNENSGMIPLYSSFINTQVSIIRGTTVLQRVLELEEIRQTQWFKESPRALVHRLRGSPPVPRIDRLRSALTVKPLEGSEVIEVAFVDSSATEAVKIVNAILDEYTKHVDVRTDPTKEDIYKKVQEEFRSRQEKIASQEDIIARIREDLGTGNPAELVANKRIRLDEMGSSLSELRRKVDRLNWEISRAKTSDSNDLAVKGGGGTKDTQPAYHQDSQWRELDSDVRNVRHRIDISPLKDAHQDMVQMKKELEFAEKSLRRRETQLDDQWRDRAETTTADVRDNGLKELAILEDQLERAQYDEQTLSKEYEKQLSEFRSFFERTQNLGAEETALAHERELFEMVRQRLEQKNVERNVPGVISILAEARASSRPEDRRIAYTAIVLILTAGLSSGAAYLRATRSQTIHAVGDMPHLMQVQLLGQIPVTRIRGSFGRSLQEEVQKSRAQRIESVRLVRTALLSRLRGHEGVAIQVTSAGAGTGKSTFTTMLGKSLAQAGKSVLIIDADLRRMTLTKRFGLSGESGFVESLRSKAEGEGHIFPTEESGLSIMPAGNLTEGGAVFEETANGAFKSCMSRLRKQYNVILLDSSPVLPVADATILSSQVDATIMVERELVSHRAGVIDALDRLDSAGGRLLGTVFVGSGSNKSYGSDYDHDYETTSSS